MSKHPIHFNYLSQDDPIQAGAFDLPMVIDTAEQAMLDFEQQKILFPEKLCRFLIR
ncbi:hypothetical protein [Paraglaciecola sp. MB-3u-78]|jgi:hypothetical protein|uniref:hypothetical protein n=1 Tax=Paraglaciecola sp. MB-3u-78 TaxID=2058332 RepID=UPI0012FE8BFE|nr:hypothetical protein [Paraglaciecola sp. MB-3u-78]